MGFPEGEVLERELRPGAACVLRPGFINKYFDGVEEVLRKAVYLRGQRSIEWTEAQALQVRASQGKLTQYLSYIKACTRLRTRLRYTQ